MVKLLVKRKIVFDGKLIKLYQTYKDLPGGKKGYFEEIVHPGAALIIPVIKGKVAFIRQYRGVIDKYIWELPAGTLEPNETPYACAKREVIEETGYVARKLKKIGEIFTTPGFTNEKIHLYQAECVERIDQNMDHDEVIKVKLFTKAEVKKLFSAGKINDAKTIAALSFAGML